MKKKLSVLLLMILVLPLFALFGCDETLSFPVYVYSSSTIYGSVTGTGTYNQGDTVTLTANAKQGSHVIGWIYQNSLLLEHGVGGYTIHEVQNSEQKTQTSTLSFTLTDANQGKYTAVFDDSKMMYTKFSSFRISSNPNAEAVEDGENLASIMSINMTLSQGTASSNLVTVYQADELEIKNNVSITPTKVNEILKLSTTTSQHIKASTQITYNQKSMTINFRADIGFQTDQTSWIKTDNYNYKINYADGQYKIVFEFKVSAEDTYYLILNYSNLSA